MEKKTLPQKLSDGLYKLFGGMEIVYEESIETYLVRAAFTKTGDTTVTLVSPSGDETVYDITVGRDTYRVSRRDAAPATAAATTEKKP